MAIQKVSRHCTCPVQLTAVLSSSLSMNKNLIKSHELSLTAKVDTNPAIEDHLANSVRYVAEEIVRIKPQDDFSFREGVEVCARCFEVDLIKMYI